MRTVRSVNITSVHVYIHACRTDGQADELDCIYGVVSDEREPEARMEYSCWPRWTR